MRHHIIKITHVFKKLAFGFMCSLIYLSILSIPTVLISFFLVTFNFLFGGKESREGRRDGR